MNIAEESLAIPSQSGTEAPQSGIGRPSKELTKEYMVDPQEMTRILNRTQNLCDEAYEDLVDDYGARLARLVLRAQAVAGNIKALELYFKIVRESKDRRASSKATRALPSPENASFVRRSRRSAASPDASASVDDSESTG